MSFEGTPRWVLAFEGPKNGDTPEETICAAGYVPGFTAVDFRRFGNERKK